MSQSISQVTRATAANLTDLILVSQNSTGPATGTSKTLTLSQMITVMSTALAPIADPAFTGNITLSGRVIKSDTSYMSLTTTSQEIFRLNDFGSGVTKRLDLSYISGNNSVQLATSGVANFLLNCAGGGNVSVGTSLFVAGMVAVSDNAATWAAGTGAPTGTQPAGSLWSRTDGATGSRLYVSAGSGTWNPVAGV